jgi:co-chaperonin GroES (HSP10)
MDDPRRVTIEKDGEKVTFRLLGDRVYVRVHAAKKEIGSIILPDSMDPDLVVATVLARGPGEERANGVRVPVDVEPGDVVVFHRWNLEHKQGQAVSQYLDKEGGLIQGRDILLVFPPGSDPEVW